MIMSQNVILINKELRSGTVRAVVYSTSVQSTLQIDLARLVSQCGARRLPVSTRYNSYRLIQRQRRFKTNHYEELSENGYGFLE